MNDQPNDCPQWAPVTEEELNQIEGGSSYFRLFQFVEKAVKVLNDLARTPPIA